MAKKKADKSENSKIAEFHHSPKTIERFTYESDDRTVFKEIRSIRAELSRVNPEKEPIKNLYWLCKQDVWLIQTDVEETEALWEVYPISFRISHPHLIYLKDKFDWVGKKKAVASERKSEFIKVKNIQYPDMAIRVETITYLIEKDIKSPKKDGFLNKQFPPRYVLQKEDHPKLFRGASGSFYLVECRFPARITVGYLTKGKFRKEKMLYKILSHPEADNKKYLTALYEKIQALRPIGYGFDFLSKGLFDHVFPKLSGTIQEFEGLKALSKDDTKLINEIKCLCEFKIDAVSTFLVSIIESFVNRLLEDRLLSICQRCGDLFHYRKEKKILFGLE